MQDKSPALWLPLLPLQPQIIMYFLKSVVGFLKAFSFQNLHVIMNSEPPTLYFIKTNFG